MAFCTLLQWDGDFPLERYREMNERAEGHGTALPDGCLARIVGPVDNVSADAGDRWVEVAPAGAETTISILPPGHGLTPGVDTRIRFLTNDAEADHADLRARGVDVDAEIMRFGGPVPPMFGLRDPDGNAYYVVEST